ncbi:hypothetical protein NPIL_26391, partial [Nephila pilipes]
HLEDMLFPYYAAVEDLVANGTKSYVIAELRCKNLSGYPSNRPLSLPYGHCVELLATKGGNSSKG